MTTRITLEYNSFMNKKLEIACTLSMIIMAVSLTALLIYPVLTPVRDGYARTLGIIILLSVPGTLWRWYKKRSA